MLSRPAYRQGELVWCVTQDGVRSLGRVRRILCSLALPSLPVGTGWYVECWCHRHRKIFGEVPFLLWPSDHVFHIGAYYVMEGEL